MRAAAAFLEFAHDAAAHMIARQQFRRPPGGLVPLGITPSFIFVAGGL